MKPFLKSFLSVCKYFTIPNTIIYSIITIQYHSREAFLFALFNAVLFRLSLKS